MNGSRPCGPRPPPWFAAVVLPARASRSRAAICPIFGGGVTLPSGRPGDPCSLLLRRDHLRKIAAAALALPFIAFYYASSVIQRTSARRALRAGPLQLIVVCAGIALVVSGLLLGLPAKQVAGVIPPTFAPLAPQGQARQSQSSLPLDVAFQVQFTKPMNESSVEGALTITPSINVKFEWDATAQVLSLAPDPHWQPFTNYEVDISTAATDQEGLSLAQEMQTSFQSGAPTSGTITATETSGDLTSPASAFQITFTRPVKLSTVVLRFGISPHVPVTIVGDDPTDVASQVFTMTPNSALDSDATYVISMADGGTDAAGAALESVAPLQIHTMVAPAVVRFRPQDGGTTYDSNQPVSVRFTVPMDEKSTAAAFSVTVGGRAVSGGTYWAEDDTVLVLTPRYSFAIGSTVIARVSTAARSADGQHLSAAVTATFKVSKPRSTGISYGGAASASSPWYASEVYYLHLMNCTRTGGWVTYSGTCSSETHHTLPAQSPLTLNASISNRVSRPYAKYMADNKLLDHYLRGTTPHSRLTAAGYPSGSWGENIASPSSSGKGGMISVEIFYQNESWCRCEHYFNIMDPYFHQVGIGVWVSKSVRVAIDFYG